MTASCRRSRFSIFSRSTALEPAPPTPTSLIAMLRSVSNECSRGSSLRFIAGSGAGKQAFDVGKETVAAPGGGRALVLRAHPIVQQAERRVIAGVAQVLRDPRGRLPQVRRHAEHLGGDLRNARELGRAAGEDHARDAHFGRKRTAEFFLHDLEQLPRACPGDLLDGLARELAVTDGEIAVEPDLLRLVARLDRGAAEPQLEFFRLTLGESQT